MMLTADVRQKPWSPHPPRLKILQSNPFPQGGEGGKSKPGANLRNPDWGGACPPQYRKYWGTSRQYWGTVNRKFQYWGADPKLKNYWGAPPMPPVKFILGRTLITSSDWTLIRARTGSYASLTPSGLPLIRSVIKVFPRLSSGNLSNWFLEGIGHCLVTVVL